MGDRENRIFSEKMANHLLMVGLILLAGTTMTLSKKDDEDCPFRSGCCGVGLGDVVDVYFHDIDDKRSCQRECRQIEECKFFTMKPDPDDPHDHMKCFLFKTCDPMEACDDCITGPELPLYDPDDCFNDDGNYTCETSLEMWLMYIFLMLKILSPVKINVKCLMTVIGTPFSMSQMHPSPITNAFCSKNAISTNLVRRETGPKNKRKNNRKLW